MYIYTLGSNIFRVVSVVNLSVTVGIKLSLNLTTEYYITCELLESLLALLYVAEHAIKQNRYFR